MEVEHAALGNLVIVSGPGADESFDQNYIGCVGEIIIVACDDYGASPEDPYVIVALECGNEEMFWPQELKLEE